MTISYHCTSSGDYLGRVSNPGSWATVCRVGCANLYRSSISSHVNYDITPNFQDMRIIIKKEGTEGKKGKKEKYIYKKEREIGLNKPKNILSPFDPTIHDRPNRNHEKTPSRSNQRTV